MTPAIRVHGLVKDYGRTRALHGVDLEVRAGEVFGFLGPNGSGKSTTIRVLMDLLRPTAVMVQAGMKSGARKAAENRGLPIIELCPNTTSGCTPYSFIKIMN